MKRFVFALMACFLIGGFPPILDLTASTTSQEQAVVAISQEPDNTAKLVVKGPTKVRIGDLVVISVEESRAASFKWIVLPSTDNFLVIDQGKRVVFSSGSEGEFKFIVACSLGDTCDVAVHTVIVGGGKPTVINSFGSKIAQWCELVESDTKRDEVLALSHSFSTVAIAVETGGNLTTEEIIQATYEANQEALGDKLEDWLPFREALANELFAMSQDGRLNDKESHVEVWKLIAKSLREYAETLQ